MKCGTKCYTTTQPWVAKKPTSLVAEKPCNASNFPHTNSHVLSGHLIVGDRQS